MKVHTGPCWTEPDRSTNGFGYNRVRINGRLVMAHRFSYEFFVGDIPPRLDIDHLCRNRGCYNPAHLEPVTRSTNLTRGYHTNRDRTHCKRGHEFTPDNLVHSTRQRICKACHVLRNRGEL